MHQQQQQQQPPIGPGQQKVNALFAQNDEHVRQKVYESTSKYQVRVCALIV